MIKIDFRFRAVGQGAFYTAIFKHQNGKQFSFVYDCGTHSSRQYINQEINNFVTETSNEKIDILFISHFHDDHINKISDLLNQTGGAKQAILPYLTPDELLLAYIEVSLSGGDPETLAFIRDPTAFLVERKVEHIIYIHPDDEQDSEENNEPIRTDPDPESNDFQFVILNQLKKSTNITDTNIAVSHYYDSGEFSITGLWKFKFFNKSRTPAVINAFIQSVKALLDTPTFNFNDLSIYLENNPTTFETGFNNIYSNNFGARQLINDTSLVIHHGPLRQIKRNSLNHRRWLLNRCSGTLLTGDIIFNKDCLDEIILKWGSHRYTIDVGIFQIPHHGANNYLSDNITTCYPQVQWWVINFGLGNTHKHPHQDIVNMVIDNNMEGQIFCNTQTNELHYGCIIEK
ncbi:hypothetical protein AR687_01380 [Flavobacteriaceae bacterium CRH]|nr:hypothetical protein AR687_01380 [Flavobacteriaceae bacterium CRH]